MHADASAEPQSESVRALLMTAENEVLLMCVSRHPDDRGMWIMPGGRREIGETPERALRREIREELGLDNLRVGPELWAWTNVIAIGAGAMVERERAFLVRTDRFEPSAAHMKPDERQRFRGFRWWQAFEIARSEQRFIPSHLGSVLEDLVRSGPPPSPREVEGLRQH